MSDSFTRRNLPHWYEQGLSCFVTYAVAGALPASVRTLYEDTKRAYREKVNRAVLNDEDLVLVWDRVILRLETFLEKHAGRDTYLLSDPAFSAIVLESLLFLHRRGELRLLAVCVMSNHVHVVADRWTSAPSTMMGRHKSFSASSINKLRKMTGRIFQDECWDHLPRTLSSVLDKANYTVLNAVTAGMVERVMDHPGTWFNREVFELIDERLVLRADCVDVPRGLWDR